MHRVVQPRGGRGRKRKRTGRRSLDEVILFLRGRLLGRKKKEREKKKKEVGRQVAIADRHLLFISFTGMLMLRSSPRKREQDGEEKRKKKKRREEVPFVHNSDVSFPSFHLSQQGKKKRDSMTRKEKRKEMEKKERGEGSASCDISSG